MDSIKINQNKFWTVVVFLGWVGVSIWMYTDLKADIKKLTVEVDELTFWSYLKLGQLNKSDTTFVK